MKKYILKTFIFLLPIISLILITEIFYVTDQGDLLRLGFLYDFGNYRSDIEDRFNPLPINYREFSTIDVEKENKFTVLTIGDSFSELGNYGYKNYLANKENISVVHLDRYLSDNPIQTLISIANGDLFETLNVDYIILQSIERNMVFRAYKSVFNDTLDLDDLKIKADNKSTPEGDHAGFKLFSDRIFKVPLINFLYLFLDKPYESGTYKVNTSAKLFTNKSNSLLFYENDIEYLNFNNDSLKVVNLHKTLEHINAKLKSRGIHLIVLPCPDKYGIYYDNIIDRDKYPRPLFFNYFNALDKNYLYVDTKALILNSLNETKDVYYYDDTHWTPMTAEIIGDKLFDVIKSTEELNPDKILKEKETKKLE